MGCAMNAYSMKRLLVGFSTTCTRCLARGAAITDGLGALPRARTAIHKDALFYLPAAPAVSD